MVINGVMGPLHRDFGGSLLEFWNLGRDGAIMIFEGFIIAG